MREGFPHQIGKYRILCKLGQGGMAVVYLARGAGPAGFCRLFAIKTIHEQYADQKGFVEMFFDEARLAARIHHPNAVPVYEVGIDQGLHYIAMDYVNGETLATIVEETWKITPPFPIPLALHIIEGVCEALHSAHELTDSRGASLDVVHRDVSPQNILIGYDGIPRIADFGIAKAADQLAHTRTGAHKGKAAYMAPEQISRKKLDRRVDVFALGVVLWESITGHRLFKQKSDFATMERIREGDAPNVQSHRRDVPDDLARIIDRALALDPEDRHTSTRELALDLRAIAMNHNLLAATPDLEHHMRSTFAKTYAKRLEITRRALEEGVLDPTGALELRPSASIKPTPSGFEAPEYRYATHDSADPSQRKGHIKTHASRPKPALILSVLVLGASSAVLTALLLTRPKTEAWVIPASGTEHPSAFSIVPERSNPAPLHEPPPPPLPERIEVAPLQVYITFDVAPAHASLRVNGRSITKEWILPASKESMVVEVSAPGFKTKLKHIIPDHDQQIEVTLVPRRAFRKKPFRHKKPKAQKTQERVLLDGDDL